MSAGAFLRAIYESDAGTFHPIRVQPETVALVIEGVTNTVPGGPINSPISARVGGSRRGIGLKARTVTVEIPGGGATGYIENAKITLPVLDPATYLALAPNQTGTYLGQTATVLYKTPERVR